MVARPIADKPFQEWAVPLEMPVPLHSSRMEQAHELPCDRVDPRQIRSLVQIVMMAGESQVRQNRGSIVLPRDNVLNLEWSDRGVRLGKPAVTRSGSGRDGGRPCAAPGPLPLPGFSKQSTRLGLKDGDQVDGADKALIFLPFLLWVLPAARVRPP